MCVCARVHTHVCTRLVAQLCLTLWDPLDYSLSGSSVHEIFQARNTGVGCHLLLQGIFLTQESNLHFLCLLHCRQILYPLSHRESLWSKANLSVLLRQYSFSFSLCLFVFLSLFVSLCACLFSLLLCPMNFSHFCFPRFSTLPSKLKEIAWLYPGSLSLNYCFICFVQFCSYLRSKSKSSPC